MFFDKFKLNNKIALITGGAKGIGLSIAHALGEAGAKLVVIDRDCLLYTSDAADE